MWNGWSRREEAEDGARGGERREGGKAVRGEEDEGGRMGNSAVEPDA